MKKALLAIGLLSAFSNTHAACPSNLNGTWVGTQTDINTYQGQEYTSFKVLVGKASGNTFTIVKKFVADGTGPTTVDSTPESLTGKIDKSGCTVTIDVPGGSVYGAFSNNGQTIQFVQGFSGQASLMTFNKQ